MARKRTRVWIRPFSKWMLFTCLMLGGLIFLFAPQGLTNKFQFAFARTFSWPLGIGRSVTLAARTPAPTEPVSRRDYNQLQSHLANVIEQRDQAQKKFDELSELRVKADWQRMNFVLADIITVSDGLRNELIINRGEEDGLAKGQFVLGDNSIIGRISSVSFHTARVKLFADATSKIEVKIAELNADKLIHIANGLMHGDGKKSAKIPLLSKKLEVKTGNVVLVREKPGLLDVPIMTGKVVQCKTDEENPLLWDITIEPVCDIERLNNVAVIVMNPRK